MISLWNWGSEEEEGCDHHHWGEWKSTFDMRLTTKREGIGMGLSAPNGEQNVYTRRTKECLHDGCDASQDDWKYEGSVSETDLKRLARNPRAEVTIRKDDTGNADFYELVKYVEEEPESTDEWLTTFFEQGMWPDKPQEHIGFTETREEAEEWKETLENHRTKDGWYVVIRERDFS